MRDILCFRPQCCDHVYIKEGYVELYFATRSEREGAPVLIWRVFSATARSAMVVSAVTPEEINKKVAEFMKDGFST